MMRLLQRLEDRLNHPFSNPWDGYPDSHWGPRSQLVCDVLDRLTGGWFHD